MYVCVRERKREGNIKREYINIHPKKFTITVNPSLDIKLKMYMSEVPNINYNTKAKFPMTSLNTNIKNFTNNPKI